MKDQTALNETKTIHKALQPDTVASLKSYLCRADFEVIPLGQDVDMYATKAPQEVREALLKLITEEYGKEFEELAVFCRFNDAEVDTSFRIHSDGIIGNEQPTLAVVYYVNSGDTGTALFVHDIHGDHPLEGEERIYTENDHGWIVSDYCEQKENTAFIYDARRFHSRFPPKAYGPRFTVIGFYKENNIGPT